MTQEWIPCGDGYETYWRVVEINPPYYTVRKVYSDGTINPHICEYRGDHLYQKLHDAGISDDDMRDDILSYKRDADDNAFGLLFGDN
jgi:hypothetical protein